MEEFFLVPVVDFTPEMIDVDVDDVRAGIEIVTPDMFRNYRPGQNAVEIPHEIFEEGVFPPRQVDYFFTAAGFVGNGIEMEIGDAEERRFLRRSPSEKRPGTGEQFSERKRFCEIIVGPAIEPFHFILGRAFRRQHEHRDGQFFRAQAPENCDPVLVGKKDVEDDQVVPSGLGELFSLLAVAGNIDRIMFFFQSLLNKLRDLFLIFDDKYLHARLRLLFPI
jgi:hypothetical protein